MKLIGGHVETNGQIDGKQQWCVIDTGSGGVEIFGRENKPRPMISVSSIAKGIGKTATQGTLDIVPSIKFIGFEVTRVPSWRESQTPFAPALLGSTFLKDNVVTIDYKQQVVDVRSREYGSVIRTKTHDTWYGVEIAPFNWVPIASFNIDGVPTQCMLDTGAPTSCLNMAFATRNKLIGRTTTWPRGYLGQKIIACDTARPVRVEYDGQSCGFVHEAEQLPGDIDVLLGNDILRNFRLTIDYPDGITYLEPYEKVGVAKGHRQSLCPLHPHPRQY